jgi:hypothetical protein
MTITSTKTTTAWAEVDENGRLILPPEVARHYGLNPGSKVRLDEGENFVRMHRPVTHLTKVYIEPTVACNLDCITCFRNAWDQPIGRMTEETFENIFNSLKQMDPIPDVYFGGIGEPLFHVKTIEWIRRIKQELGVKVELITNGTILTEKKSRELIDAGLDILWVSMDGATPEVLPMYAWARNCPPSSTNMKRLFKMRGGGALPQTRDRRCVCCHETQYCNDLPKIIKIGKPLAPNIIRLATSSRPPPICRPIACIPAPCGILPTCRRPVCRAQPAQNGLQRRYPGALTEAFNSGCNVSFAGNNWGGANDVCNFVESGTMSIAWTGDVSPCWPLMHTHMSYLHSKPRFPKNTLLGM